MKSRFAIMEVGLRTCITLRYTNNERKL